MVMNIVWRIPRIWKNDDGYITTVEFVMELSDDNYPGQKSMHGGIVSVSHANLLADDATREDISEAVLSSMHEQEIDHLLNFHLQQIMFEHERATNEVVEIDPGDTQPSFPDLSARQLRIGLITNGIDPETVSATINAMPDGVDKQIALTEWNHASSYERSHHLITMVGTALGLTEEQIDTMWIQASTL